MLALSPWPRLVRHLGRRAELQERIPPEQAGREDCQQSPPSEKGKHFKDFSGYIKVAMLLARQHMATILLSKKCFEAMVT